ncbi:MAG: RNA polymerase II mediator complex subunit, partial [Candelina submexicana]
PNREAATQGSELGKEPPVKPYVLVPPPIAPRFPKDRTVDFFPWSGDHPEDVLSEQVTKQGFYDKSQVSQNETNTASTALRQTFKHKSGLQTLSSLFVSIYEQRQAHGRVTAPSTFKPPPRVTLTDTKREAWLRDLANPSVPLRRLSRTIPHGIRGKVLLEQCLGKNIPTARAVWLAKCVGANEMRAFKRKGASGAFALGGEVKWVRDWTVFVEQFLEGVISICGEKDWKSKMDYTARLSSHLFAEHLLDKDHYFGWLLTSFAASSLDKVPIWLLVLQIFWEELIHSRKNGRRLAESLLEKLLAATNYEEKELFIPIVQRLSHLVTRLMVARPSNFVLPKRWSKYQTILHSCVDRGNSITAALYAKVTKRNLRFVDTISRRQDTDVGTSSRSRLIELLDSAGVCFNITEVYSLISNSGQDHRLPIITLLEWMSSSYREGVFRVFVAVRILRKLSEIGTDINGHILDFLARSGKAKGLCKDDECDIRLLAELPLQGLPTHVLNLRRMLLKEAGFNPQHEARSIAEAKGAIAHQLPNLFLTPECEAVSSGPWTEISVSRLSRTVLSEVCHWIRQQVRNHTSMSHSEESSSTEQKISGGEATSVTAHEFDTLRSILESCQDLSILADVLRITMSSNDPNILASIADTLNMNLGSLAAVGAINELFHGLVERERAVSRQMPPEAFLLTSILDVGSRLPGQDEIVRRLRQDLGRCEQLKATTAAWSPISDHMPDALPNTDIREEVERILASGTSMEKHTLTRLFDALLIKLKSVSKHSEEETTNLANLLSRLRRFDVSCFDGLMVASLDRWIGDAGSPCSSDIVAPLVSSGSISLLTLFESSAMYRESNVEDSAKQIKLRATVVFLELVMSERDGASQTSQAAYHWRLKQRRFIDDHALELLTTFVKMIEKNIELKDAAKEAKLNNLLQSPAFTSMLRILIVQSTAAVQRCFASISRKSGSEALLELDHKMDQLLGEDHNPKSDAEVSLVQDDMHGVALELQIIRIMRQLDDLTLPFCQMKLQLLFKGSTLSVTHTEGSQSILISSLYRSISSAVADGSSIWVDAVSVLDNEVVSQIREQAEGQIMSSIPTNKTALAADIDDHDMNRTAALHSLSILAATAYSIPQQGVAELGPNIIENIEGLLQSVSHQGANGDQPSIDRNLSILSDGKQLLGAIYFWVDVLLRVVIIHRGTFQQTKVRTFDQARLLIALCSILVSEYFEDDSDLTDTALDVASCLVDDLPDEARIQCMKYLKERSYDSRLRYLFGYQEGPSDRLKLSQRGKLRPYPLRHWEILPEPTPVVGDNDTSLSLTLFEARKA